MHMTMDTEKREIEMMILGIPQQQGSTKSMPYRKKDGRLGVSTYSANDKLQPWRDRVEYRIREVMTDQCVQFNDTDPLYVNCTFTFLVPASRHRKRKGYPLWHTTVPDVDKLIRAILDAVTVATGIDDSRVARIETEKRYTDDNSEVGAYLRIRQFPQCYLGGRTC